MSESRESLMIKMMKNPHISIIIPAYNEEKRIASVLKNLRAHKYNDIIVIDDGSTDKTALVAKRVGAKVIKHKVNKGQGAGLRTGIGVALTKGADVIVTFDSDGQHKAEEIERLIGSVLSDEADVTLGSRFLGSHRGMPWYKWITLKGSILVERILLGVKMTDVHNGFRAMNRKAARTIEITEDRMAHASEIVYEIKRKGLRHVEVPVTIEYDKYVNQKGQSIFNAFRILLDIRRMKRRKGGIKSRKVGIKMRKGGMKSKK